MRVLIRRWSWALLLCVSILLLSFNFSSRQLLTNDDTRFPVMARDVLTQGHWLVPALQDGRPHLAKPPLVVWLITLASWPAGAVSAQTAILPSLLEAVGVVLVTSWIGRRLFGAAAGLVAGLVVVTTVGVFSFAHSAMPDMALLLALTGAMAAYVAAELGGSAVSLVTFYGLVGIACLTKGAAGLLPVAIVLVYTITVRGVARLGRVVSIPGLVLLLIIAVPWWIVAAVAGRGRFASEVVVHDQFLWYFRMTGRHWQAVVEPITHAVAITLPWCILLPFAIWKAMHEADAEKARRVRLVLVWLATVFAIIAISDQQRERYYLPLCPALALLIGWWCSTLAWTRRAWLFGGAWIAVVATGAVVDTVHTQRFNAHTDLAAVRAALGDRTVPLYATDVPELALTFNLDRPVLVSKSYRFFETRVPADGLLIISDRALESVTDRSCMRQLVTGTLDTQPFTLVSKAGCRQR
jgi:4-amino-4-deoxy-L-arabinose transferase-like glycosyltransferase